jgi:hypothetical protein
MARKIRALGREDAAGFVQVVCIDQEGKVVQDDAIDYLFLPQYACPVATVSVT